LLDQAIDHVWNAEISLGAIGFGNVRKVWSFPSPLVWEARYYDRC